MRRRTLPAEPDLQATDVTNGNLSQAAGILCREEGSPMTDPLSVTRACYDAYLTKNREKLESLLDAGYRDLLA